MTNRDKNDVTDSNAASHETKARRRLVRTIAAGGGVAATGMLPLSAKALPQKWVSPIVEVTMLPAHAQTTGGLNPPQRSIVQLEIADSTRTIMDAFVRQAYAVPAMCVFPREFCIQILTESTCQITMLDRNGVQKKSAVIPFSVGVPFSASVNVGDVHNGVNDDIVYNLTNVVITGNAQTAISVSGNIACTDNNGKKSDNNSTFSGTFVNGDCNVLTL